MAERSPDLLDGLAAHLRPPLRASLDGEIPPNIALMRLMVEAQSAGEVEAVLQAVLTRAAAGAATPEQASVLDELRSLLIENPAAFATVKAVMAQAVHARPASSETEEIDHWRDVFDRLAVDQPEAGVALYALGSADMLERATAELVELLDQWGLLGPERRVLEIGCGIGRIARFLAPRVAEVVGTDVSNGMIERARERCAGLQNVGFTRSDGRGLSLLPAAAFDLVLAVDVFPYLVQAGGDLARRHFDDAYRVLKPEGALAIFNYSYRGDPDQDRADVHASGREAGFTAVREPRVGLAYWDGWAVLLDKS